MFRSLNITGRIWKKRIPIFRYPFDSNLIHMWELREEPSRNVKSFPVSALDKKMVQLPMAIRMDERPRTYALPLLH